MTIPRIPLSLKTVADYIDYLESLITGGTTTNTGILTLATNDVVRTVTHSLGHTSYTISLTLVDAVGTSGDHLTFLVENKGINSFDVRFSNPIPSNNYRLEWVVFDYS